MESVNHIIVKVTQHCFAPNLQGLRFQRKIIVSKNKFSGLSLFQSCWQIRNFFWPEVVAKYEQKQEIGLIQEEKSDGWEVGQRWGEARTMNCK